MEEWGREANSVAHFKHEVKIKYEIKLVKPDEEIHVGNSYMNYNCFLYRKLNQTKCNLMFLLHLSA